MPFTRFPNGVSSFGTPLLGSSSLGWKKDAKVLFVDVVNGLDGYEGTSPENALSSVGRAITLAGPYGVIYVLDAGLSGTDPVPYREAVSNLYVPYAKNNLAIIGVPHNIHEVFGLQIKAALALTTPVLWVAAPFCAIENLDFNGTGDALARGNIAFQDDATTTFQAQGSSVYNCHLRNGKGVGGVGGIGGGVTIVGGWYYTIKNCHFDRCRAGVWMSGSAHEVKTVRIEDNLFTSDDVALVDFDIYTLAPVNALVVHRNVFGHAKGTYAGAASKYVHLVGSGVLSENVFANATGLTWGASGKTGGDISTDTPIVNNYDESSPNVPIVRT
jgi:hypothetical protein